jgi:hypothetical protein
MLIMNLLILAVFVEFGSSEIISPYMAMGVKYGDPCTLVGGILASIPSVTLYAKLTKRALQARIPSGDLRSYLEEISKLMGGRIATDILKMGYN